MTDNFLILEDILLAALEDEFKLPQGDRVVKVLTSADLQGVTEQTQHTPAVHLVYQTYRVIERRPDGRSSRIEQTWLTIVATTNKANLRTGKAARSDAGAIARRVLKTLMGFKPSVVTKPLQLTDAPGPGFNGGFQYLPFAFVAELVVGH